MNKYPDSYAYIDTKPHAFIETKHESKRENKRIDWEAIAKELLSRYYTADEQDIIISCHTNRKRY